MLNILDFVGAREAQSVYEFSKSFLTHRRGVVAVIEAFMDESGVHAGAPAVTSSVVWQRPSMWKAWTKEWVRSLGGIKHYHASECHSLEGEFRGWSKRKRDDFVIKMLPIIPRHKLYGRTCGLHLETYYNCLRDEPKTLEKFGNPYFACIHWAMRRVCEYAQKGRADQPLAIVHENNDFRDYVLHAFDYTKRKFPNLPMTLRFGSKEDYVPLQAADIVAYEGYKFIEGGSKTRKPMQVLDPTGRRMLKGIYDKDTTVKMAAEVSAMMAELTAQGR